MTKDDYMIIITHDGPQSDVSLLGFHDTDPLKQYLEKIKETVSYKQWIFGHYHENKRINALDDVLYEQIVRIG